MLWFHFNAMREQFQGKERQKGDGKREKDAKKICAKRKNSLKNSYPARAV